METFFWVVALAICIPFILMLLGVVAAGVGLMIGLVLAPFIWLYNVATKDN